MFEEKNSRRVLNKEQALYQALFGTADMLSVSELDSIQSKLEVLIDLFVKHLSKEIDTVKQLNELAGYERFKELEQDLF